jgi:hypothetical protein
MDDGMSGGSHPSFVHSDLCCCTLGVLTEFYGPVKSTLQCMAMPNDAMPQEERWFVHHSEPCGYTYIYRVDCG